MRVLYGYDDVPADARAAVLAVGNFDGVHRGHQALLEVALAEARHLGTSAGVIVFEPHPREYFQPDRPHFRLTPLPRKLTLLEGLGLDLAVVLPFNAALAGLSAQEFVARVLVGALQVRHIVIGYDFHFGKGRSGNPETMRDAGKAYGFGVTVVPQVGDGDAVFSSSAIRAALARGDVGAAARALGHWWRVAGTVVGGAKRGTGMGFPTANLVLPAGTELGFGIYAVRVYVEGHSHAGAAYLGRRPTFDNGDAMLEVFLLDFDDDLYGRQIEVEFVAFVRPDAKFDSTTALAAQMQQDVARTRAILADAGARPPGV